MDSLVAWVRVTRKRQLRVVDVEATSNPEVMKLLEITAVPALALLQDGRVVGRLEGKATGDQIEALIRPYVDGDDVS
jgi:thioredoxin-like negative regulator of GroEL